MGAPFAALRSMADATRIDTDQRFIGFMETFSA